MPHHLTARMAMLLMNLWVRFYSAVYKYDMGPMLLWQELQAAILYGAHPTGDKYGANQE